MSVEKYETDAHPPVDDRAFLRAEIRHAGAIRHQMVETGLTLPWPEPLIARARARQLPDDWNFDVR